MENFLHTLLVIAILTLNGFLAIFYWLFDHFPVVASWLLALGVLALLDNASGAQAGFRPRRYDRGQAQRESITIYFATLGLALAWTAVGLAAAAPIPLIGMLMWVALLVTPLSIPIERDQLAGTLKWMLGAYTAAVAGFLVLLRSPLDAAALAAWSAQLGQPGAGNALESAVISSITPTAALLLWIVGPVMYFGYVVQRLRFSTKTRVNPWATVEARIRQLRGRGEG